MNPEEVLFLFILLHLLDTCCTVFASKTLLLSKAKLLYRDVHHDCHILVRRQHYPAVLWPTLSRDKVSVHNQYQLISGTNDWSLARCTTVCSINVAARQVWDWRRPVHWLVLCHAGPLWRSMSDFCLQKQQTQWKNVSMCPVSFCHLLVWEKRWTILWWPHLFYSS